MFTLEGWYVHIGEGCTFILEGVVCSNWRGCMFILERVVPSYWKGWYVLTCMFILHDNNFKNADYLVTS